MPSDDLRSIPGLQDKYRRVLTGKLKITTFRALVDADRHDIYRAMRDSRLRPTHEQIAKWQDHARSRLSEAKTDRSEWHPAASFAVVFAQRQVDDGWEHRIEVERTEVEPEQEPRIWPGWDCAGICGWMREQIPDVGRPEPQAAEPQAAEAQAAEAQAAEAQAAEAQAAKPQAAEVEEPTATPAPAGGTRARPKLRIDRITVIGPAAIGEAVAAGTAATTSQADPGQTPRIEISVSGSRRDQEVHAGALVVRRGEFGRNLQDPVVIKGATGVASFDLSPLPAGRHDLALAAWVPDGGAQPALAELRDVTIPPR